MSIHPTAIITGDDVTIHPDAVVEPYAVITGPVEVDAGAYIGPHAVIGAPAQHSGTYPAPIDGTKRGKGVRIGARTCVREFSTIHQGIMRPTVIGSDCLLMVGCHVGHDSELEDGVTFSCYSSLGGFTSIGADVTFGQGVIAHPWVVVGRGAMVGLNTSLIRDVEPFTKVAGAPGRVIGDNFRKQRPDSIPATTAAVDYAEACAARDKLKEDWYARA